MNLRYYCFRGLAWVEKLNIIAGTRSCFGFGQYQTEDTDFHAGEFSNHKRFSASERLSRRFLDNISGYPSELRFLHPLFQDIRSKVELMISESRIIESGEIPGLNHLRTFVSYRFHGRGNSVAGEDEKSIWALLL